MTEPEKTSIQFCGVAVLDDVEYPCVLEDQHGGFCEYGPEYEKALAGRNE